MSIRRGGHWLTASSFIFPPFHLIIISWSSSFKMYSCGREYIYTWIGVYVYTWIHLETLMPWWVAGLYRFTFYKHLDNASPHAMKDATGVPPDRLCVYVSRAWRKCKAPQSEGAHETTCGCLQTSRWDASDSHLIVWHYCMSIRREGHWLTASSFIFPPFHLIII